MARTGYECPDCGGVVSETAKTCPHCHAEFGFLRKPVQDEERKGELDNFITKKPLIGVPLVVIAVFIMFLIVDEVKTFLGFG